MLVLVVGVGVKVDERAAEDDPPLDADPLGPELGVETLLDAPELPPEADDGPDGGALDATELCEEGGGELGGADDGCDEDEDVGGGGGGG